MFAQPHNQMRAVAGLYQSVNVDTGVASASPHRLIEMLFEEFLTSCRRARGAIEAGDVSGKGRAIVRAVRIVDEGLRGGLNMKDGGALAHDLHELYGYVTVRLTQANLKSDPAAVAECMNLIQPLYDAWHAIGPLVAAAADAH